MKLYSYIWNSFYEYRSVRMYTGVVFTDTSDKALSLLKSELGKSTNAYACKIVPLSDLDLTIIHDDHIILDFVEKVYETSYGAHADRMIDPNGIYTDDAWNHLCHNGDVIYIGECPVKLEDGFSKDGIPYDRGYGRRYVDTTKHYDHLDYIAKHSTE